MVKITAALLLLFSPGLGVCPVAAITVVAPQAVGAGAVNQAVVPFNGASQGTPSMALPSDSILAPINGFSAAQPGSNVALPPSAISGAVSVPTPADGMKPQLASPNDARTGLPAPSGERSLTVRPSNSGQMPGMDAVNNIQALRGQDSRGLRELAAGLLQAFSTSKLEEPVSGGAASYEGSTLMTARARAMAQVEPTAGRGQGSADVGTAPKRLSLSLSPDGMRLSFDAHEDRSIIPQAVSYQTPRQIARRAQPSWWESFDWAAFKAWLAALFNQAYGTLSLATR